MPDTTTKTDEPAATPEPTGVADGVDEGGDSGQAGGEDPSVAPAGSGNGAGGPVAGEQVTTPPPVHVAIARVIAKLPSIEKGDKAPSEMGGYQYRGIERIMSAAQKILAVEGIVFYGRQRLVNYEAAPPGWEKNNRTHRVWTETTWYVYGPAGDRLDPEPITQACALDGSDKAINKAATQAKKYMLMDLLQIADQVADADGQTFDPGPETQAQPADSNPIVDEATGRALAGRAKKLPDAQRAELAAQWKQEDPMTGQPFLPLAPDSGKPAFRLLRTNDVPAVEALILRLEKAAKAAPESVADRAQRMAQEHTGKPEPETAQAGQDAPGAPAAGDGGQDSAEPADGPTAAVPEGTEVAIVNAAGERVDLADEDIRQVAARVQALAGTVPSGWVNPMVAHVEKLHHAHVDREIRGIPGQTIGEGEDIQKRRMRVSLVRLMVERDRLAAQADG